jgi:hypothetical protein
MFTLKLRVGRLVVLCRGIVGCRVFFTIHVSFLFSIFCSARSGMQEYTLRGFCTFLSYRRVTYPILLPGFSGLCYLAGYAGVDQVGPFLSSRCTILLIFGPDASTLPMVIFPTDWVLCWILKYR